MHIEEKLYSSKAKSGIFDNLSFYQACMIKMKSQSFSSSRLIQCYGSLNFTIVSEFIEIKHCLPHKFFLDILEVYPLEVVTHQTPNEY